MDGVAALDQTLVGLAALTIALNDIPVGSGADTFVKRTFNPSAALGTSTITLPSESVVKTAVDAVSAAQLGVSQTWQQVTRLAGTTYTNNTGRPIFFSATTAPSSNTILTVAGLGVSRPASDATTNIPFTAIIPNGISYSYTGTLTPADTAYELR